MDELHDADLLARWRSGDRDAFAILVSRHHGLVQAACRRQAPAGEDDDCTQAVFMILARKPAAAARAPALAAWLQRTTWFVCEHARRSARRRRQAEQAAALPLLPPAPSAPEVLDHLDGCLLKLSEKQRAAVTLHYLAGKTAEEVAATLGTNRDHAYLLISRGLAALRRHLARRGVAVAGTGLVGLLAGEAQAAAASTPTAFITCLSATPSARVVARTTGALRAMTITTVAPPAAVAGFLLAIGLTTMALSAEPKSPAPEPAPQPAPATVPALVDLSAIPAWGGEGFAKTFALSPDGRWLVSDGIVFAMPDGRAVGVLGLAGRPTTWGWTGPGQPRYLMGYSDELELGAPRGALVDPASGWRTHAATLAGLRDPAFSPDGRTLEGWVGLRQVRFPVSDAGIGAGTIVAEIPPPDRETVRIQGKKPEGLMVFGDFDLADFIVNRLKHEGRVQGYASGSWLWIPEETQVWRHEAGAWSSVTLDHRAHHMTTDPTGERIAVWHNGSAQAVSIYTTDGSLVRRWTLEGHSAAAWSRLTWLPGNRLLISGASNRNGLDPMWWEWDIAAAEGPLPAGTPGWPIVGPDGSVVGEWVDETLQLGAGRSWTITVPRKKPWGGPAFSRTDAAGRWFVSSAGQAGLVVVDLARGAVLHPTSGATLVPHQQPTSF